MTNEQKRKAPYGIDRLVIFPIVADGADGLVYGDAYPLDKSLMSANDQPTSNSTSLYASNQEVDRVTTNTGGTLEIGITQLNAQDHITILGAKAVGTTGYISNKDDAAPFVGVAYISNNSDGTVNLHKFFKCKFTKGNKSRQSKGDGSATFQTDTLSGNYSPTIFDGNDKAEVFNLSPTTDRALIDAWLSEGGTTEVDEG